MSCIVYFVLGTIIGSFLNVCIYRIPRYESIICPPSHCIKCNNKLRKVDLIPILSFLLLKGRCRYCFEKISIRYTIIESITGVLFLLVGFKYGISIKFFKYIILISILIVVSVIDIDTMNVYFNITLFGIIFGLIFMFIEGMSKGYSFKDYIIYISLAIFPAMFIVLIILTTKAMGWGDVDIILISSIFLGFKLSFINLVFSFLIGTVGAFLLIILKKKKITDPIPFTPFIFIASILVILFGNEILIFYLSLI